MSVVWDAYAEFGAGAATPRRAPSAERSPARTGEDIEDLHAMHWLSKLGQRDANKIATRSNGGASGARRRTPLWKAARGAKMAGGRQGPPGEGWRDSERDREGSKEPPGAPGGPKAHAVC